MTTYVYLTGDRAETFNPGNGDPVVIRGFSTPVADTTVAARIATAASQIGVHVGYGSVPIGPVLTDAPVVPDETAGLATLYALIEALPNTFLAQTLRGVANGLASLDGAGLVPPEQLPALAIDHLYVVASQAAMLALSANVGDVAVRTDLSPRETFILQATPASTLGNWVQITTAGAVTSVNGRAGAVDLTGDYVARPVGGDAIGSVPTKQADGSIAYVIPSAVTDASY